MALGKVKWESQKRRWVEADRLTEGRVDTL